MRNFIAPFVAVLGLFLMAPCLNAQSQSLTDASIDDANFTRCNSHEHHVQMMGLSAKYAANRTAVEQQTAAFIQAREQNRSSVMDIVTIPIVFHVIYNDATQNIPDARLLEQLQILNDDFRRQNADADGTWAQAADTEVEFCLATTDPQGNPTDGIVRVSTTVGSFGSNDAMKFTAQGGSDAWPASDYLNFWVCNLGGGLLGYAQFPGGPASTDGVVCGHYYVGLSGASNAPFNLGRTGTHEVGHWLNLYHIWGDGGCNIDDDVADTPASDGPNFDCQASHESCGTTDMVQNYMDYSDDLCMNLFTQGQADRMAAVLAPNGIRGSLRNSDGCGVVVPDFDLDVAIPEILTPVGIFCNPIVNPSIELANEGAVTLTSATLTIALDGTEVSTTEWTGSLATGQSTTVNFGDYDVVPGQHTITATASQPNGLQDQNTGNNAAETDFEILDGSGSTITVNITTDNYGGETSWTITPVDGNAPVISGGDYGNNTDYTAEATCQPTGCYVFEILDAYGDGICCDFGNGSYEVLIDGEVVASGGVFGASESVEICIGGGADIQGCTDTAACNYEPDATQDDGSCTFPGCTDPLASNYDAQAGCPGPCTYIIDGCTDTAACNYDPDATNDNGSCTFPGCTDPLASNYDAQAGCPGPCTYDCDGEIFCGSGTSWNSATQQCEVTFAGDADFDGCINVTDILMILGSFGSCL